MASYADGDDMIARYDSTVLGHLCADDGTPISEANLPANTKMTTALATATGRIDAALMAGDRYTAADLDGLTAESLAFLVDITCAVAFWLLWRRRPHTAQNDNQRKLSQEEAEQYLELLRTGVEVFTVSDNVAAGKPDIETISRVDLTDNWNLVVDRGRGKWLPARRSYRNR